MEQELTPWFPPEVKPLHVGAYQTKAFEPEFTTWYQHWNGRDWSASAVSALEAAEAVRDGCYQYVAWRGLAADPAQS